MSTTYRGRFAPSPTGPLHLGSLIAALSSYLDAKHHNGQWLVRIDDLDPPREVPGSAENILNALQTHGLHWDEDLVWQSKQSSFYETALTSLSAQNKTFACDCSRQNLTPLGCCQSNCEQEQQRVTKPAATRIAVPRGSQLSFDDALQGPQSSAALEQQLSDFVIKRKDDFYAYQLAVVVDDAKSEINHIVRGADLMDSTPRQIFLQQALELPTPNYAHLPVITNPQGQKFSKQNHAPALIDGEATQNLRRALSFLGQTQPPGNLDSPGAILAFARQTWSMQRVPKQLAIAAI
ncbi:MAG: tRNA glutamyl-Q(34) synthetase GluQRS [Halioglobus sp.]